MIFSIQNSNTDLLWLIHKMLSEPNRDIVLQNQRMNGFAERQVLKLKIIFTLEDINNICQFKYMSVEFLK